MNEDHMKYWQAVNRQNIRFESCAVVKVRRLSDRYRVWRRAGDYVDFSLEQGAEFWPCALVEQQIGEG